jgi:hypothetical protein
MGSNATKNWLIQPAMEQAGSVNDAQPTAPLNGGTFFPASLEIILMRHGSQHSMKQLQICWGHLLGNLTNG